MKHEKEIGKVTIEHTYLYSFVLLMLEPNTRYLQQQRLKAIHRHAKKKTINYTNKRIKPTLCAGRTKMIIFNRLIIECGWMLCEWVNAVKWIKIVDDHHRHHHCAISWSASVSIIIIIIKSLAQLISFAEYNKSIPRWNRRRPNIMRDARVRWPNRWHWHENEKQYRSRCVHIDAAKLKCISIEWSLINSFLFVRSNGWIFFICFSSEWYGRWVSKPFNTLVWLKVYQMVKNKKWLWLISSCLEFGMRFIKYFNGQFVWSNNWNGWKTYVCNVTLKWKMMMQSSIPFGIRISKSVFLFEWFWIMSNTVIKYPHESILYCFSGFTQFRWMFPIWMHSKAKNHPLHRIQMQYFYFMEEWSCFGFQLWMSRFFVQFSRTQPLWSFAQMYRIFTFVNITIETRVYHYYGCDY